MEEHKPIGGRRNAVTPSKLISGRDSHLCDDSLSMGASKQRLVQCKFSPTRAKPIPRSVGKQT